MSLEVEGARDTAEDRAALPAPKPRPPWRERVLHALWRPRHVPFVILLLGGAALRYVTWRAYRPALLFPDSKTYLRLAHDLHFGYYQPSGYPAFLYPLVRLGHPSVIPLVQHLMALAIAVALYVLLQRWAVPAWAAALATAPLLFDPLQLDIEQMVLSDTLFQTLLCAALVAMLWRRRPGPVLLGVAGLAIGLATVTRGAGTLLVLAAVVTAVGLGSRWRAVAALVAAFALPVGAYVLLHHQSTGHYAITDAGSRYVYARLTPFVDCSKVTLPTYERPLCPSEPLGNRPNVDHYMWSYHGSPQWTVKPPPGMTQAQMVKDYDRRVIEAQPLAYAHAVARDFVRGFAPSRSVGPHDINFDPFKFHRGYQTRYIHRWLPQILHDLGASRLSADPGKAAFLVGYMNAFHVPGPLLGACLIAAVLALLGLGRAKQSGLRTATWAFTGMGVLSLLTAAMAVGFSWRYQLPQMLLMPPAGALAATAMLRKPHPAFAAEIETTSAVDRLALGILALPLPARLRRVTEHRDAVKMVKYGLGSAICTVVSAVVFVLTFGSGLLGSRAASLSASATAAVVGYWLNRAWTWERRHRADWRRELLPYWATIIGTAVAAALITGGVNAVLLDANIARGMRTFLDMVAYFAAYAVSFVVKYVVFDRLFAAPHATPGPAPETTPAAETT